MGEASLAGAGGLTCPSESLFTCVCNHESISILVWLQALSALQIQAMPNVFAFLLYCEKRA